MPALPESSNFPAAARRPQARRLLLANYRSYSALDLAVDASVIALTGEKSESAAPAIATVSGTSPGPPGRNALKFPNSSKPIPR